MASAVYPKGLEGIFDRSIDLTGDIRAVIVDSADYTYNAAHDNLDDVAAGARIATTGALQNKTYTNGVFDADDITVANVTGDPGEVVILYRHTGTESSSRLVAYLDGVTITPNGANVTISWAAGRIFGGP